MQQDILPLFYERLNHHYQSRQILIRRWPGSRSPNIIELQLHPLSMLLYTKISNLNPGFWGLNSNQIHALDQASANWFVVLLYNTPDKGFILSSRDVQNAILQKRWSLSDAGDYKVHDYEVAPKHLFSSFNTFTSIIL